MTPAPSRPRADPAAERQGGAEAPAALARRGSRLQWTSVQLQVAVATIAATAAVLGPATAAGLDLLRSDPAPAPPDCVALVERTLDLIRRYPEAARLYAHAPVDARLPQLANAEEISGCGNPTALIRRLRP